MDCKYCPLCDNDGKCSEEFVNEGMCMEGLVTRMQRAISILTNDPAPQIRNNAAAAIKECFTELIVSSGGQYYPILHKTTFKIIRWDKIELQSSEEDKKILGTINKAIEIFEGIYTPKKDPEF